MGSKLKKMVWKRLQEEVEEEEEAAEVVAVDYVMELSQRPAREVMLRRLSRG